MLGRVLHKRQCFSASFTWENMASLHPEILNLIVDLLHDEPETLKACCVVSKTWIYRTRKHLFNHVKFLSRRCHVSRWREIFPDPQNSPVHHTRILSIFFFEFITAADANTLLTFCRIPHLNINTIQWPYDQSVPLVPLRGFFPAIRSLHLTFSSVQIPDILALVCSFPVLDDLSLVGYGSGNSGKVWNTPSASPRLAGSLELRGGGLRGGCIRRTIRNLLDFPNGLQFEKIAAEWTVLEAVESTVDLVSRCSDTLEHLEITNYQKGTLLRLQRLHDNFSSLRIDPLRGVILDLSKATKLKHVEFGCKTPDVEWVSAVLHTAKVKTLRNVSLVLSFDSVHGASRSEMGWVALDRLLVQLWTSHSLRPRLRYDSTGRGRDLGRDVTGMLPEATRGGVFDIVEGDACCSG